MCIDKLPKRGMVIIYVIPFHILNLGRHFVGQKDCCFDKYGWNMENARESDYLVKLDYEAKTWYKQKLKFENEELPDPYSLTEVQLLDDLKQWADIEFGNIYTYLINTKRLYTKESLKAYKSLKAYNFFHSGHVRTVYFYKTSTSSRYAVLIAKVNPGQKSSSNPHEAWVILLRKKTAP